MTMGDKIKEIVMDMDRAIHRYLERNRILELECQYENGSLKDGRRVHEFESRRRHVMEEYDKECTILRRRFRDALLMDKAEKGLFDYMPREIIIDRGRLRYPGLDEKMPIWAKLPLVRSMWTYDEERSELVRMMLRLLLALPLGKCEFYVYDPEHYGASIEYFDQLLKNPKVFPAKKVFTAGELTDMLNETQTYMASLNQDRFPSRKCKSWREYNDLIKESGEPVKKIIPYKVLVFFGMPINYERGDIDRISNIAAEGHKCGILTLFSLHNDIAEDGGSSPVMEAVKRLKESALELNSDEFSTWDFRHLRMERIKHIPTDATTFRAKQRIEQYKDMLDNDKSGVITMDELLREDSLFKENATDGLEIPLGTNDDDGELQYLRLGDETAHFLVGGTTGSGKSNLLHDIVLNACWRYPPTEVNFILLDYKSGVEFSQYVTLDDHVLPHAELVAQHADVEYGLTVLKHLCDELERRNNRFKAVGESDYVGYRKAYPSEVLPRMILIVDEFQTIFQDTIDSTSLEQFMQTLSKKGRSAGIHMIFATQTMKALADFGQVATQFAGRIALKCSNDDSCTLLSYDNDAAAELVQPYAILNTQNGRKAHNQKFAVPYVKAEAGRIEKVIKHLDEQIDRRGMQYASRKVFDGEKCPAMPQKFMPNGVAFHIGQRADYNEGAFWLELDQSPENNVLIIGERGLLLESIIMNAQACEEIEEIDYIGNKLNVVPSGCDKLNDFADFTDYFKIRTTEDLQKRQRIIIVDGVKFSKRLPFGEKKEKESWEASANMLTELCDNGSHLVAFFATYKEFKRRWQDMDMRNIFGITLGYYIAPQEWQYLTDDPKTSNKLSRLERTMSRATCICNGEVTHFRPFAGGNDEQGIYRF